MSKETELSDEQIKIAAGQWAVNVMGEENLLRISRQVIAADRELRLGAAGMTEPFGYWHQGETYGESDFHLHAETGDVSCESCTKLYSASQVQAMLAQGLAAQPLTQERKPMTQLEINSMVNSIAHYSGDYEDAIVCAVEKHHGIRPISDGEAIK